MERHGKQSGTRQMIEMLKLGADSMVSGRLREAIENGAGDGLLRCGRGSAPAARRRTAAQRRVKPSTSARWNVRTTAAGDERI